MLTKKQIEEYRKKYNLGTLPTQNTAGISSVEDKIRMLREGTFGNNTLVQNSPITQSTNTQSVPQTVNGRGKLDSQLQSIQEKNKNPDSLFGKLGSLISTAVKSFGDTATRMAIKQYLPPGADQLLPENVTLPEKLRNPLNPTGEISLKYSSDPKIKAQQMISDTVNALPGAGVESKTLSTLTQPIKNVIPKTFGALKGAATAGVYAGLQGTSAGLQEKNPTVSSVLGSAYNYATNPFVLATGAVLGFAGGAMSKENITLKQKKVTQAVNDLEDTYYKLSTNKSLQTKLNKAEVATQRKNLAGTTGTNPIRTLAEEGIVPEQTGGKLQTTAQANTLRSKLKPMFDIQKEVLEEMDTQASRAGGTGGVSLVDLEDEAIRLARTPQNIDSGKFSGMQKEIQKEFADLRDIYGDTISYSKLGDIKSARWNGVKFDANRPLISDANYVIAKTAQQRIQNEAEALGNDAVAQLNRYIGDRLEAAKYLDILNGVTVKGGRLQRYVFQAIGSTFGNNPLSKILGAFGGDAVANMLLSNQVSPILKRKIIAQIQAKSPEVYKQTIDWLTKAKINPKFPLALPEGRTGPVNTGVIAPPAPTTFEKPATKIGTTNTGVSDSLVKQISEKYDVSKSLTSKIIESALKELGLK